MIRRRRYLVKTGLQFRYIGVILFTVFLVSSACITTTYYNLLVLLGEKLANVYPQGRLIATLKNVNLIVLSRLAILVPFIAVAGLFLSHRIAGPVFRIEKILSEIGKGNFDIHVKLRKRDELKDMAEAINDMAFNLRENRARENNLLHEALKSFQDIKDSLNKEPLDKKNIESKLNSILKKLSPIA